MGALDMKVAENGNLTTEKTTLEEKVVEVEKLKDTLQKKFTITHEKYG